MVREIAVEGRRIPLSEIRMQMFKKFTREGIIRNATCDIVHDLMVWADHASVLNNGHLLITVKTIYSKDAFFTTKEMLEKGKTVNTTVYVY